MPDDAALAANPLLADWVGPDGGVPPFHKVRPEHFVPAYAAAMDIERDEIARIVSNPEPPTFDNTLAALEGAGRLMARVGAVYGVMASTQADKAMQAVEQDLAPVLAAFGDEIVQNPGLFARIRAVYDARETSGLTPEQQRLAWVTHRNFESQGAGLDREPKAELGRINQRLASLYATFSQNELADEENHSLTLEAADLAGLPEALRASAASAAAEKGLENRWLITNTRSSMEPFLIYSDRRDLREQGWRLWVMRGDNGGEHDNKAIITEILQLRARKAALLGYPTYAHWVTADNMAGTPDAAMALMLKVWPAALARARQEVADMQAVADAEGAKIKIAPWDYRHYAEKVRKARYDLDQNAVRPYLQLEKIRQAMCWCAGELYGLEFTEIAGVPTTGPDIRVFQVSREGAPAGLWYFDPYARAGKQSGAWMSEYRTQERFEREVVPIVSNNCNFVKGEAGAPVLISWDDAVTMFHEFGHALHGLCSAVRYPSLAGTNVARDFVEFPSQLNEHWLQTRALLTRFALHHQTGQPIPDELVARIEKAKTFNQGFTTVEYLASAIYDLKIHLAAGEAPIDPEAFEKQTMSEIGLPPQIVMRHRPTHFGHVFAGDGYSAGYYDYIWADTLTADAAEAFAEAPGGFYDKAEARRLHDAVLSVGNTVEAAEAFRHFRGRDVNTDALMRDRGFPVTA